MSDMKNYKCLSCGNSVMFDPPSGKWKCDFCSSEFTVEEVESAAISMQAQQRQEYGEFSEDNLSGEPIILQEYHCNNCGSEIIADDSAGATFCIYCKSPIVLAGKFQGELNPHRIIPFSITEAQAKDLYREWIKKKFFAPKSFKLEDRIKEIRGIYAPFWIFAANTKGHINVEAQKIRRWEDSDYEYTETSFYEATRGGHAYYRDVPVDSSTKMEDELMEAVEPFDYEGFKQFNLAYLSGFLAEITDVSREQCENLAKKRMEEFMESRLTGELSQYDNYIVTYSNYDISDLASQNVMMPVYYLANPFKGEMRSFMVNGQTGKVYGHTPYDIPRIITVFIGLTVIIWLLSSIIGGFFI